MASIVLSTSEGTAEFGSGAAAWTVDGEAGSVGALTKGQWHDVVLDLASSPDFQPGPRTLKGHLAVKSGKAGGDGLVVHLADIRLVEGGDGEGPAAPLEPGVAPVATPAAAAPAPAAPGPAKASPRAATTAAGPAPTGDPVTVTIHPENLQEISHWGFATQNRPDWGPGYDIGRNPAVVDALYRESGASLIRFHIDYKTFDDDRAKQDLKKALLAVTSRGLDWYGAPWSPPVVFKTLDTPNGKLKKEFNRLKPGHEDEVAVWLVDLVKWLEAEGVPLPVALSPQNEPDFAPPSYPGCLYTGEQLRTAVVELRKALDAAGYTGVLAIGDEGAKPAHRTQQADPDSGTLNMMGLHPGGPFETDAAYREAVDVVATHTYDVHNGLYTADPGFLQRWVDLTSDLDRPLWMTEWETRHEHTFEDWGILTETFTHFNRDLSSMGFNAWFSWQAWRGFPLPEEMDVGESIGRIRAGDALLYEGVDAGAGPAWIDLRVAPDSGSMSVEIRKGGLDGELVGGVPLRKAPGKALQTVRVPVSGLSGTTDLTIVFTSGEHWREAQLNWFELDGGTRVEAESLAGKVTKEKWSSSPVDNYVVDKRSKLVYGGDADMQLRPIYYVFKKIWTNAPAGGGTFVRRATASGDALRGETKAADPESYRQDLSAFVHDGATTATVINRNAFDLPLTVEGLTGSSVEAFLYTRADAESVNRDMASMGTFPLDGGTLTGLDAPGGVAVRAGDLARDRRMIQRPATEAERRALAEPDASSPWGRRPWPAAWIRCAGGAEVAEFELAFECSGDGPLVLHAERQVAVRALPRRRTREPRAGAGRHAAPAVRDAGGAAGGRIAPPARPRVDAGGGPGADGGAVRRARPGVAARDHRRARGSLRHRRGGVALPAGAGAPLRGAGAGGGGLPRWRRRGDRGGGRAAGRRLGGPGARRRGVERRARALGFGRGAAGAGGAAGDAGPGDGAAGSPTSRQQRSAGRSSRSGTTRRSRTGGPRLSAGERRYASPPAQPAAWCSTSPATPASTRRSPSPAAAARR